MDLVARLKLQDDMTSKLQRLTKNVERMSRVTDRANTGFKKMAVSAVLGFRKMDSSSSGLATKLTGLAAAIGGVAAAGKLMKTSLGGAMSLEQNQIAMEHWIGLTQGAEKAKAATEDYMKFLRSNANMTPFQTQEVIDAGRRAINVASGDIKQAKKLLTIAEDLAALNPNKSLMDAMEALADLKVGESQRMVEFGFKISAEDIKGAGGAMNIINNQIAKTFEGGASKLSKSSAGLWSTITGSFTSGLADAGVKALDKLKRPMEQLAKVMSSGGLDKFFNKASDLLASFVDKLIDLGAWLVKIQPQATKVFRDSGQELEPLGKAFSMLGIAAKSTVEFILNNWKDVKPFIFGIVSALAAWSTAQIAVNIAMAANPIGALIVGIGALVGASIWLVENWDKVKEAGSSLWANMIQVWNGIVDTVKGAVNYIIGAINTVIDGINSALSFKLPDWLPGSYSGKSFSLDIPKLPELEVDGSHASGLSYVPHNGYIARLHKGERVMTSEENREYSNGGNKPVIEIKNNTFNVRQESDIEEIARQLARKIYESSQGMSFVG